MEGVLEAPCIRITVMSAEPLCYGYDLMARDTELVLNGWGRDTISNGCNHSNPRCDLLLRKNREAISEGKNKNKNVSSRHEKRRSAIIKKGYGMSA
ncbi:hypothetical protein CEXT_218651 [Caerostris extrusa]|uniref:Uncharacterized protein n=1 Tax=Caerostris extrusa TaxID=172846 RepID=A0AAV4MMI4_CAEEX|nr:hypothetical protein CEXT_218651 [Caerostris extrusa]